MRQRVIKKEGGKVESAEERAAKCETEHEATSIHLLTTMPLSTKHYPSSLFWLVNNFCFPVTYKYVCKQVIYICLYEKRRRYFKRFKVGD